MDTRVLSMNDDDCFQRELLTAGRKLMIVDFYAHWCTPCHRIAPALVHFANKYPNAIFLKIDVDRCPRTVLKEGITAMPTFVFYKDKVRVDVLQGPTPEALEIKIKEHYVEAVAEEYPPGQMDLSCFYNKAECECFNEAEDHALAQCLDANGVGLWSDCDEQLIINLTFNQPVRIHSLQINAPKDEGPREICLFQNLPRTLDFSQAESMEPVQTLELKPEDLEGSPIALRYVRFQNVLNLQLFIANNQGNGSRTKIDRLVVFGSPLVATNMGDFKRVSGKKGESH